jgi:hypothetical protein
METDHHLLGKAVLAIKRQLLEALDPKNLKLRDG